MADKSVSVGSGFGLPSLLTVLFVGLKLTGYIAWSWWWVLSPLWISSVVGIVVLLILLAILVMAAVVKG